LRSGYRRDTGPVNELWDRPPVNELWDRPPIPDITDRCGAVPLPALLYPCCPGLVDRHRPLYEWRPVVGGGAGPRCCSPMTIPVARSRTLPYQWDAAIGRVMASAALTIRIDLDSKW